MQNGSPQVSRPAIAIDLVDLRFTAQELDAVRRGLTIALTKEHRGGLGAQAQTR